MKDKIKHIDPFLGEIELEKVDESHHSVMGHSRVDILYVFEHNERKLYYHYSNLDTTSNFQITAIDTILIDLIKKNI